MTSEVQPSPGLTSARPIPAKGHVCWVVDESEEYASTALSLLSEAPRFGQCPVLFTPAGAGGVPGGVPGPLEPPAVLADDPVTGLLGEGRLDPAPVVRVFREHTERARANGYEGVRLIADMDWLHSARIDAASIAAFETHVEHVAAELGSTVICAYRRSSFPAAAIEGAITVHSQLRGYADEPPFRLMSTGPGQWRLSGEVDFSVSRLFKAAFTSAVRPGYSAVDLRGLEFIDVSGMRAVLAAAAEADGPVVLRNARRIFRRYWELCDFGQVLPNVHLV